MFKWSYLFFETDQTNYLDFQHVLDISHFICLESFNKPELKLLSAEKNWFGLYRMKTKTYQVW